MTVDEFDLRRVARDLERCYRELDAAKHTRPQPKGERVLRPRPGPQAPGNLLIISLDRDLVSRLHEYARDAANHVEPAKIITWDGAELCAWVAWHASAIADLDFATDMMDEMVDQARKINRRLHPAGIDQVANRPEPRHVSGIIIDRMAKLGHTISRDQLRTWAARGHITSKIRHDGRATYLLSEVVSTTRRKETHGHREH